MTNLLSETLESIKNSGHTVKDIEFIGSNDGRYSMTWDEFSILADREYDNGFGGQEVVSDLVVKFRDGQTMWRGEYDGSEWWNYSCPLVPHPDPKPITTLFSEWGWSTIAQAEKEAQNGR